MVMAMVHSTNVLYSHFFLLFFGFVFFGQEKKDRLKGKEGMNGNAIDLVSKCVRELIDMIAEIWFAYYKLY